MTGKTNLMTRISTNDKFPYSTFLYRLELKDGKDKRICWFECQEHVDRFLKRQNLKKKDYILEIKEND
jgi:hypothetical protein